jgi:hypothetical protein
MYIGRGDAVRSWCEVISKLLVRVETHLKKNVCELAPFTTKLSAELSKKRIEMS